MDFAMAAPMEHAIPGKRYSRTLLGLIGNAKPKTVSLGKRSWQDPSWGAGRDPRVVAAGGVLRRHDIRSGPMGGQIPL